MKPLGRIEGREQERETIRVGLILFPSSTAGSL